MTEVTIPLTEEHIQPPPEQHTKEADSTMGDASSFSSSSDGSSSPHKRRKRAFRPRPSEEASSPYRIAYNLSQEEDSNVRRIISSIGSFSSRSFRRRDGSCDSKRSAPQVVMLTDAALGRRTESLSSSSDASSSCSPKESKPQECEFAPCCSPQQWNVDYYPSIEVIPVYPKEQEIHPKVKELLSEALQRRDFTTLRRISERLSQQESRHGVAMWDAMDRNLNLYATPVPAELVVSLREEMQEDVSTLYSGGDEEDRGKLQKTCGEKDLERGEEKSLEWREEQRRGLFFGRLTALEQFFLGVIVLAVGVLVALLVIVLVQQA